MQAEIIETALVGDDLINATSTFPVTKKIKNYFSYIAVAVTVPTHFSN
jgi:hypothetical protein